MQKKLLVISAVLVFISVALYTFMLIRSTKIERDSEELPSPTAENGLLLGEDPNETPLFVELRPEVKAIIDKLLPTWISLGSDQYAVLDFPKLEAPSMIPDYSITYNSKSQVFTVLLYQDSLLENRQKAAESLAQLLQIPINDLCSLNV